MRLWEARASPEFEAWRFGEAELSLCFRVVTGQEFLNGPVRPVQILDQFDPTGSKNFSDR